MNEENVHQVYIWVQKERTRMSDWGTLLHRKER